MRRDRGQILVGVIVLLLILSVLVPTMVLYVQNEARWSAKQQQNTNAFQLAEAAADRGYQKVTESTATWTSIQAGTQLSGYHLDTSYSDLPGGSYAISITSGPGIQSVTIIGVGRDKYKKEVRALKVVYANSPMSGSAIRSGSGVTISGSNVQVEFGSVVSNTAIATSSRNHPQFYSADDVTPQDSNGSLLPNTDSVQWWSYDTNLPPTPYIDFDFYKSSAQATGTYYSTAQTWGPTCGNGSSCNTGNTYYIDGDLNVNPPGIFVGGTLIVRGNLNLPPGRGGQGAPTFPLPQSAWKQYGNAWSFYTGGGPACTISWNDSTVGRPSTFPGLNSSYLSDPSITVSISDSKALVNGFLYVGGNLTAGGGAGQTKIVGAAYVVGSVTLGSNNICVFYTDAAGRNIVTTHIILSRQSWQDSPQPWPSGL